MLLKKYRETSLTAAGDYKGIIMFCPNCGSAVGEHQAFCHACGSKIEQYSPAGEPREKTAWELRQEQGFFQGLLATMKESLFSPTAFFRKMPVSGGLTDPTLYAMIAGMSGITMLAVWQILYQDSMPMSMPGSVKGTGADAAIGAILAPFLIIAHLYLWAGMLHILLVLVRGGQQGYEATFRVVAHSYGAMIFLAVPFFGWPVAAVWTMILAIIGLKEAQGVSGGKAAFAVLFPALVCCAAAALFTMLVFGAIATTFGGIMHHSWK